MTDDGTKHDSMKMRFDLLPTLAEEVLIGALTLGAIRYGGDNWRKVPDARNRYFASMRRHMSALRRGERLDVDGLPHVAGALASLVFLAELDVEEHGRPDYDALIARWMAERAGAQPLKKPVLDPADWDRAPKKNAPNKK